MHTHLALASTHESHAAADSDERITLPRAELVRLAALCQRAARGDLEARITDIDPASELVHLSQAINAMLDMADSFVREAAAAMEHCSREKFHRPILVRGLRGAYEQSARVINRAGEKMRENRRQLDFVSQLADQNAHNVQTVAAACEELSVTGADISRRVGEVSTRTDRSVIEVAQASAAMQSLGQAASKIDGIVALINKVAGQTHLLALNATIEAARVGEHGRGFTIVAAEVKELSQNTRKATGDISREVEAMQKNVRDVSQLIGGITQSIQSIAEGAATITHSVQEQAKATVDISHSIHGVSENSRLVSERILQGRSQDSAR
jgi:methyl-accepting chemotaxis protein